MEHVQICNLPCVLRITRKSKLVHADLFEKWRVYSSPFCTMRDSLVLKRIVMGDVTVHYLPGFLSADVPRIRWDTVSFRDGGTMLGTTPHLDSPHDSPRLLLHTKCSLLPLFVAFTRI